MVEAVREDLRQRTAVGQDDGKRYDDFIMDSTRDFATTRLSMVCRTHVSGEDHYSRTRQKAEGSSFYLWSRQE